MNMDDDNNNNDDNNNADEEADQFPYRPGLSTTCIFSVDPELCSPFMIRWAHHPQLHVPANYPPSSAVVSSSNGLALCRNPSSTSISTYFVGNPFHNSGYISLPPCYPRQPPETHCVLIATRDNNSFHVVCLVPYSDFPLWGNFTSYTVETFSSNHTSWQTLSRTTLYSTCGQRRIVPDSGVSCGRWAYWLTWLPKSKNEVKLVRVDIKNPEQDTLLTYYDMPEGLEGGVMRMNLGRIGNTLGLVVVHESESRVELYTMNQAGTDEDHMFMSGWTQFSTFLHVELDPGIDRVQAVGSDWIRCGEIPWPIRFESYKMEVLLVQEQRLVLWERSEGDHGRMQVKIFRRGRGGNSSAFREILLDPALSGVPHVTTSLRYSDFIIGWENVNSAL